MNNCIEKNLYSKIPLKFDKNGKFKILMLSDIQETLKYDKRTLININKIIDNTNPNLIVLGGDICDGTVLKTEKELKEYLDIFLTPIEKRKIPFVHVFGNHDHDIIIDDIKKLSYMKNTNIAFQNTQKISMELPIL